jgi:hypothetical protein
MRLSAVGLGRAGPGEGRGFPAGRRSVASTDRRRSRAAAQPPSRKQDRILERHSRCRRDSQPRLARRGSGSSQQANAAPVPALAGPRCNRPIARRSRAAVQSPRAAIFGVRGHLAAIESDMHRLALHRSQARQNPRTFIHGGRELRCFRLIWLRQPNQTRNQWVMSRSRTHRHHHPVR